MIQKFGTYICKGCGIGERLNCEQLAAVAEREGKSSVVRQSDMLCSQAGMDLIKADIDSGEVEGVIIAACSSRAKTEAFDFNTVCQVRTNLREGVIWARPDTDDAVETTNEMAQDYVRMGCAQIKQMNLPSISKEQEINKNIAIVGGGISGMTSAIEAAKAGYNATIIEKSGKLGGMMANVFKALPTSASDMSLQDTKVADLLKTVDADSKIEVLLNSTITKTSGAPGRFNIEIATESGTNNTKSFGAIVQSTGFKDYDANNLSEFSYTDSADVITQKELEILAKTTDGAAIKRPSDGKEVQSVVFVQCAGQRSKKDHHLDYCSGFCCNVSIKQARYFKEQNPDIATEVIYSDLITAGAVGENLYRSGQEAGVVFSKGKVSAVSADCEVTFQDLILDCERKINADLVVLATGMVANSGVNISTDETPTNGIKDGVTAIPVESILNMDYRQGQDLPQLTNGFNDSHFLCFPYESSRTGILASGPVRRPMDAEQAKEDATGAAMKAISALENAGIGRAQAPRSGDLSFPSFDKAGCTQCKRCTVECPFGAIDEDEEGYPIYNESRCRRCGTCMGACPVRVISFENYSVLSVGQQIKEVDMPDEFDEKPRIAVFACENDALPALDMAAQNGKHYSEWARVFPVRCLGSMSKDWVVDAINNGYDGVVMMGCKKGADYQCHNVTGSEMAQQRLSGIAATLETMSLESERVAVHEIAITDIDKAPEAINDMAKIVDNIGLSPLKF